MNYGMSGYEVGALAEAISKLSDTLSANNVPGSNVDADIGNLVLINVNQSCSGSNATTTFSWQIPSAARVVLDSVTYDIVAGFHQPSNNAATRLDPAALLFTSILYQRRKATGEPHEMIVSGTPTIAEVCGDGRFPGLLSRLELNPHHTMTAVIKNTGSSAATVSITLRTLAFVYAAE